MWRVSRLTNMKPANSGVFFPLLAALSVLLGGGCKEAYRPEPPFEMAGDTVFFDTENWYVVGDQPYTSGDVPIFPFAYRIFNASFEGFLASTGSRIYQFERENQLDQRVLLLDLNKQPGDTLFKYSDFHYYLVLDRRPAPEIGDEVWYILRRLRIGTKPQRERAVWAISPKKGILAVANYDIDSFDGQVTLDMVGQPEYFTDPELVRLIKYYDNNLTWCIDRERSVIYEFDKIRSQLKSRNYKQGENLYEYQFNQTNTRELIDFRIELERDAVKLVAGDSCFYFTQQLELMRSGACK
ncbi:MAG: hypothetical protein OHK0039_29350 [Bacteroidia bacterium]